MTEWREAVWAAVPEGAVPERFEVRRDWLLGFVSPGDRVLDLGCGEGSFAAALTGAGAQVTMADVAEGALMRARERTPQAAAALLREDKPLPFDGSSFDLVWFGETIEHTRDPAGSCEEALRVLVYGGVFLVTTPNISRLALVAAAVRAKTFRRLFNPASDHLRFFSAALLRETLAGAGFREVHVQATGRCSPLSSALWGVARK